MWAKLSNFALDTGNRSVFRPQTWKAESFCLYFAMYVYEKGSNSFLLLICDDWEKLTKHHTCQISTWVLVIPVISLRSDEDDAKAKVLDVSAPCV